MLTEDNPEIVCRAYAIIDEQSNASMITPNLADTLEVDAPKEKYLLSTCSSTRETKYGRKVSGLMIKSLNKTVAKLPKLIECEHIPQERDEIPTPFMTKHFPHLYDITNDIPPLDKDANIEILLGRDAPELLKVCEFRNGPKGAPWAQKLLLGWTSLVRHALTETVSCQNYFKVKESHERPFNENQDDVYHTIPEDNDVALSRFIKTSLVIGKCHYLSVLKT